jgi:hypothetical protein
MPRLVAYCGIDCAKCPAYRLPRLGEKLHMKRLFQKMLKDGIRRARRRREQDSETRDQNLEPRADDLPAYIICDGCTTIDARCLKPCLSCAVRCCAMETGVENCARCPKFPCAELERVWETSVFKDARSRLEHLRQTAQGSTAAIPAPASC